jgi:hypothetical protein
MERQAVAVCAYCGRGMCEECAVDVREHAVCAGHCEEPMRQRLALEQESRRMNAEMTDHLARSRKLHIVTGVTLTFVGLFLIILSWSMETIPRLLLALLPGLCLLAAGVTQLMYLRKPRHRPEPR